MDGVNFILAWALSQWEKERSRLMDEVETTGLSDNSVWDAHEIFRDALRRAFDQWTREKRSQRSERRCP